MTLHFPELPDQVPQRGTKKSRALFRKLYLAQGWRFEGEFPNLPKAVAIVSPHTSNFDGLYAFLAMLGIGLRVTIFGKDSLFKPPFDRIFKWIGVIPVQRDSPHGLTEQIIKVIQHTEKIWIAIAPEGTRNKAEKIKSGFYHIAVGAHIPIVMFALDYDHKVIRCLGVLHPSGDYEADLACIFQYYEGNFSPKNPERLAKPLQKLFKKR
ncbi:MULTISPECIES: lysophospholipid acyltransferase family protein [unclassified Acinetobacter]|uniref:lysophospholipid acyltransferase family protein n=1 Tax=unclassified Acinetobacter TaxID=196816 RepID=UPI002574B8C8|nr:MULTISPECIES: lysophospholipid acyltransferase family protein [unclassified Acinetobacter]MDM1246374.1 lysophospholipid acyltransferase family protein [Acinetobacter sp. R933-2]MDM1762913.1 lysophospholipid acyltransferase family protein [Acinetobacter sp. 226-1]MDM1766392.1 lysophospholipid acyltransferase family protein [Acinetobacter sp. 226-4]